jgi:hypothetical protein
MRLIAMLTDTCDAQYNQRQLITPVHTADHLLANGVTFATDTNVGGKWIPVTESLPEETYQVLTVDDEEWVEIDALGGEGWMSYRNVTHWMPLPEPPKEE